MNKGMGLVFGVYITFSFQGHITQSDAVYRM